MPRKPLPEITQQAIRKARSVGESVASLAMRFKVSERTIQRVCKGIDPEIHAPVTEVVRAAVVHGARVTIDGIDFTQHLIDDIKSMTGAMAGADVKSFEGVAGVKLKYMQFYAQLNPPTMEELVDQLLSRPDFDPERFVSLLRSRYAAKAS
ncbi:MAG: hypothetical protein RLZZ597_3104 [Cyanobacteriota bacterium]|jgi:hypothetical protein